MTNDPTAGRADHREGARPPANEGEMPPELRRLRPPAASPDLRRRALRAAEAELRATADVPVAPVAASAAMALRRAVESIFRSRVFWLAWSAALLVLLLLPAGDRRLQTAPPPAARTASTTLPATTSAQVSAGPDLRPIRLKTGPTVDDLRRRRDPFTSEGIFHHEL